MKKIFGHRGLPLVHMENSITSLNAAFEYCDYVETDVRITADNNMILFHNSDLNGKLIKDLSTEKILSQRGEVFWQTPLHYAVEEDDLKLVKFLLGPDMLSLGSDVHAKVSSIIIVCYP